ncbi:peptidoglycan-binding domain-containing protein [Hyphomonas sp.]|uniref:peptidoglycan recognition protein family protein n=1 Tax=Hyphomonas sp. TaxID=87 RepID=UPI0025B8DEC8|nr:peptidoglycan-binding domain-containing protein [Hyphomonas sp.]
MTFVFIKPKRKVTRVFWHCTATDHAHHDNIAAIREMHRQRGWSDIGYHIMGHKDGSGSYGRNLELTPAAQAGHNAAAIAVTLHGLEKAKFTTAQYNFARDLREQIDRAYTNGVTHHGHCEVAAKACPVFDYRNVLQLDARGRPAPTMTPTVPKFVAGGFAAADSDDFALPGRLLKVSKSYDDAVDDLQRILARHGYDPGTIDGWFGEQTEKAVMAFQRDHGLVADGKVGALTREMLIADPHLKAA